MLCDVSVVRRTSEKWARCPSKMTAARCCVSWTCSRIFSIFSIISRPMSLSWVSLLMRLLLDWSLDESTRFGITDKCRALIDDSWFEFFSSGSNRAFADLIEFVWVPTEMAFSGSSLRKTALLLMNWNCLIIPKQVSSRLMIRFDDTEDRGNRANISINVWASSFVRSEGSSSGGFADIRKSIIRFD